MRSIIRGLALALAAIPALAFAQSAPSFSIDNLTVSEAQPGGTAAVIIRKHGKLNGKASTVIFSTANGTALAGADYQAVTSTVTFGPSELSKIVSVPLVSDTIVEADETFTARIRIGTNARLYDGTAIVTITNDDVAAPPPPPPPPPSTSTVDLAEGDSITQNGAYLASYIAAHPEATVQNNAVSGSALNWPGNPGYSVTYRWGNDSSTGSGPRTAGASYKPRIVTLLIGANDLAGGAYASADAWLADLWTYAATVRATGAKLLVGTILPQCGFANSATHNAFRATANAAIRAAVGNQIDGVIDFAADSSIGNDADACDLSKYYDRLHPTAATHAVMASIYKPAVEEVLAGSVEAPAVASNFDTAPLYIAAGGTGAIAPTGIPDVVGAFRFICAAGHLAYDDPVVYPGQPGKSHLHQFFGNTSVDAFSTYATLRSKGDSTCNNPLNRSGYWIPAMLNGAGGVVRPDYVSIYYKRRPKSDPVVSNPSHPAYQGKAVDLPRGLRYVFGFNMATMRPDLVSAAWFNCDGPTAAPGHYPDIGSAAAKCPAGNRLGAVTFSPDCWDGKNLDSPDHRSHMAYAGYGGWGYLKCPSTHPYVVPQFTLGAWYTTDASLPNWRLSSDDMPGMAPMVAGSTFHADWFGAWDDTALRVWHDNCIEKLLSCSSGDLGNGKQLRPDKGYTFKAEPRVVPIPARPL